MMCCQWIRVTVTRCAVLTWAVDCQGLNKLSAGKETPSVVGTGQPVLPHNASQPSGGAECSTREVRVAGRAVLHAPVLTHCYWGLQTGRWSPEAPFSVVLHSNASWAVLAVLGRGVQPQAARRKDAVPR